MLAIMSAVAWLAVTNLRLALLGSFSLDEFQYGHAGWRIARGEVIYTDFFEHHFPLLHQLLGLIWRFLDDDPNHLLTLRLWMLPVFALAVLAGCRINRRENGRWALVTAAVLLAVPTLSSMATQIRPDVLSAALFLSALAVLYPSRLSPVVRGFLAGFLLVAATWGTLKVAYYGLPFAAALVADAVTWKQRKGSLWLGHFPAFLAGVVAALLPIAAYLTTTGSWGDWYRWCIRFSFQHQWHYPGFSWRGNLDQLVQHSWWLVPLAAVGVGMTIRRFMRQDADSWVGDPDLLLLASLVTTFASFAWQSAPYLYSLVPFTLVLCVFAGRGLVGLARWLLSPSLPVPLRVFASVLLVLLAVGQQRRLDFAFAKLIANDNTSQRDRLARMNAMTAPDESVFHVWGGQISRPAPHYFYFLEAVTMQLEAARLRRELVPAMVEKKVMVYLHHDLFPRLVPEMRAYLVTNFQPLEAGLWVWGRGYQVVREAEGAAAQGEVVALRDGRYFVWPPEALDHGTLEIAGQPVREPIVELHAGRYPLVYRSDGERAVDEIFVMWLPADGRTFEPRPELKPRLE